MNHLFKKLRHGTISVSLITVTCLFINKEAISQAEKDSAKLSATMTVSYKASNGSRSIKVNLKRKVEKKFIAVDNLKTPVSLYFKSVKEHNPADGTGLVGKLYLGKDGEGVFEIPDDINKLISGLHKYTFIAKFDADPIYEDAEEEISIADSKITLSYLGEDSIKTATATLYEWKDSAYVPVAGAELKLGIKRTFSIFPIGESGAVTDSSGKVSADLPLDMPGTFDRKITIVAKIDEHESFGNVEVSKEVPWSVLPEPIPEIGRALWATGDNAPYVLVFSSLSIIAVIWGTIFYLISLLIKIRKIGRDKSS